MTLRKTALLCGTTLGVALAGLSVATTASAQNTTVSDDSSTQVGEVVVVGSRIRRDAYNTPSPIQVITNEDTTLAGFNSSVDVLQSNSITGGQSQIDASLGGFVVNGGPGANTLGLRGLNAQRTLLLLNGRRLAPSGSRGGVSAPDLNVLPSAMIDHIEILKDGASSIYGSDAVAGVVNIITKKHVDGIVLESQYNYPEHGGGEIFRSSVSFGGSYGRLDVSGSFDYYDRSKLSLKDRDWALCNEDLLFDGTDRLDINPITGDIECYSIFASQQGSNGVTINTIGTAPTFGVAGPGNGSDRNFTRWRPNSSVTTGLAGFEGVSGCFLNYCRDTFDPKFLNDSLISPTKNYVLFLQGTNHFDDGSELYGEFVGSRRVSSQIAHQQMILDYAPNSPLLPTALQYPACATAVTSAQVNALCTLGIQNQDIAHGNNVAVRAFINNGEDRNSQRADAYKATLGWRGDLKRWKDWRFDVTAAFSHSDADYTFANFLVSALNNSLDVVPTTSSSLPTTAGANGGLVTCRINTINPAANCIPAPALTGSLVNGNVPSDFKDYVFRDLTGNTKFSESVLTANFDGPVAKLPYGELKLALGAEYRYDRLNDEPPIEAQNHDVYGFTSAGATRGTDHVYELYAEAEAPILRDLPFAYDLTFNASGRYTKYKDFDSNTTYKAGIAYSPVKWATLRGTIGTSFRAPAVFESHQGAESGFGSANLDPCENYQVLLSTSNRFKNCDAELHNPAFHQTNSLTVNSVGGSGLVPETSKNYTFGFILQPDLGDAFGKLQLAVDYYSITVDDEISQYGTSTILSNCYGSLEFHSQPGFCDFVVRSPSGQLTVNSGFVNIAKQRVRGIDYNARFERPLFSGDLRVNLLITRYMEQSTQQTDLPGDFLQDFNGTLGSPKYTGTMDATYSWKNWKGRYSVDWVRGQNDYDLVFGPGTDFANTGQIAFTKDYYIHHLSVEYQAKQNWTAI
ncbi:MAG TPA: TonB-dependent receptor, partial [Caulobacteraceae bacterium]|nr:TonB-dependent receptor [Caulobacteraceae bacterium]